MEAVANEYRTSYHTLPGQALRRSGNPGDYAQGRVNQHEMTLKRSESFKALEARDRHDNAQSLDGSMSWSGMLGPRQESRTQKTNQLTRMQGATPASNSVVANNKLGQYANKSNSAQMENIFPDEEHHYPYYRLDTENAGKHPAPPNNRTVAFTPQPERNFDESETPFQVFFRPCFVELISVGIYVFVTSMAAGNENVVEVAAANGLTHALLVVTIGHISGAHLNPCISLGVALSGGMSWLLAIGYAVCHLIGGTIGAALTLCVKDYVEKTTGENAYIAMMGGGQYLTEGVSPTQGLIGESFLTLVIVLTVLMTAIDRDNVVLAPLAIGFAVFSCVLAGATTTGASMNPARALGPAIASTRHSDAIDLWTDQWIYWIGPVFGSIMASLLYKLLFASDERRLFNVQIE